MKLNHIDFGQLLAAAPDHFNVLGWIVLLPLLGAIINGIWGRRIGRQGVYIAAISAVGMSFLLSILAFAALVKAGNHAAAAALAEGHHHHPLASLSYRAWDWFIAPLGPSAVEMIPVRYVVDPLSGVMLLVVTGVGTLIHVYSAGYMSHDPGYARFFAYLNLFIFAMLNLILGDSLVTMFLGWEGVGLASYLLIGFWYTNNDYATAGRKAFIVNRIGDAGLILGMTILAWKGGSYQFETLRQHLSEDTFINALHERTGLGHFLVDAIPGLSSSASLGTFVGNIDFSSMYILLGNVPAGVGAGLAELKKAGVPVFAYGNFLTIAVNFIILAFVIFMMVKQVNRLKRQAPPPAPAATPEDILLLRQIRDSLNK